VDIYETHIGGFVIGAEVVLANGSTVPIFTGPDATPCPGILSIPLGSVNAAIAGVIVQVQAIDWGEIDAVSVVS